MSRVGTESLISALQRLRSSRRVVIGGLLDRFAGGRFLSASRRAH